jgi:hypothetical protein
VVGVGLLARVYSGFRLRGLVGSHPAAGLDSELRDDVLCNLRIGLIFPASNRLARCGRDARRVCCGRTAAAERDFGVPRFADRALFLLGMGCWPRASTGHGIRALSTYHEAYPALRK